MLKAYFKWPIFNILLLAYFIFITILLALQLLNNYELSGNNNCILLLKFGQILGQEKVIFYLFFSQNWLFLPYDLFAILSY